MVPSARTIKAVFARSGNRCAFSGCFATLVEDNDAVVGVIGHIKARRKNGPRFDPAQTEARRNAPENLILLCGHHHNVVDGSPHVYTVDILQAMKRERESTGPVTMTKAIERRAGLLRESFTVQVQGDLSLGVINAQNLTIKSARKPRPRIVIPSDVTGGSSLHRSYLHYLFRRYQDFAKSQPGREFKYPLIYEAVERRFKVTWEWIPLTRFDDAVIFLQERIDGTWLGRQRKAAKQANYEDFNSFSLQHG